MITFAVFDDTGRYLYKTQTVDQVGLAHQRQDRIFVGEVDIKRHYHDLTTGMPVQMPAQPTPAHRFDYVAKAWVDPRTLDEHQAERWSAIKAMRDALVTAPLVSECGVFDADELSQARIDRVCRTAYGGELIRWTLHDNTVAELPVAALHRINKLLIDRTQRVRDIAADLRAHIDTATTPDQVAAVTWPEEPNP